MQELNTSTAIPTNAIKAEALASISASFERFCLAAGLEALAEMMEQDALAACGECHERGRRRKAIAGARPRARSVSTAARSRWRVPGFAASTARSRLFPVGRPPRAKTGSANGR